MIPADYAMRPHVHDGRRATGSTYEHAAPCHRESEAIASTDPEIRHHQESQDTNAHCLQP